MKSPNPNKPRILIADDQSDVLEALRLLFKGEDYQVEAVNSPGKAFEAVCAQYFDMALMDLNYARDTTSGKEGMDLLSRIAKLDSSLPIVVMTAWGSIELAVEAMRRGARDFVTKPWENERLLAIARTQIELGRAVRKTERLEAENQLLRSNQAATTLIAQSAAMTPVMEMIERIAPSDANVLITGENGTGKSVIAQLLHTNSYRAAKSFVSVNIGGLSEGVFESELFGHVKGAFTDAKADRVGRFELADEGTLFLDEIGNVPVSRQARLLRVLETGELERVGSSKTIKVNTRVVSATNANLEEEVTAGRFRQDLLFRLNTIPIHLPPLRDRPEDIPLLAMDFLQRHVQSCRKNISGFEEAAMQALKDYSWPGNVRELDHAVLRAVLMAQGNEVKVGHLGLGASRDAAAPRIEEMSLEEVEAFLIKKALARHGGNALKAAEALGLSRSAFYRRLEKYGL
jgi:DNA-binding NtrC family response regulator